ncbi:MAG: winged helix-turn-helix transcriptional regulator, partial [Pirellulales bacterium]|nr:winged helix-turn-helix transcriptional regulator [Pirellulales bacterium]
MNVGSFVDLDLSGGDPTRPKYEKLKQYLVQQVTSGGLKPGQALPSEQRLAESTRVARNTVRQALSELEEDGLIRRVPGRGTFVNDDARRRIVSD